MCIGIPMQVRSTSAGHADCEGRGEHRRVNTALVGECAPGDWLLVFLDSAREHISAGRAAEVDSALDLVLCAVNGRAADTDPGFILPSSLDAAQVAALTGTSSFPHTESLTS